MEDERSRVLNEGEEGEGPVLYWMQRDQRMKDNWALHHARSLAVDREVPLGVVFNLVPEYLGATIRHYAFMLQGLEELEGDLRKKQIPLFLLNGKPEKTIPKFVKEHDASILVTDFSPLRLARDWKKKVVDAVPVPVHEVDAHNIVPCWVASPKQEFAARTIRPKIHRVLSDWLVPIPRFRKHTKRWKGKAPRVDWDAVRTKLKVDTSVGEVDWIDPGEAAGRRAAGRFAGGGIEGYDENRNDPVKDGQSNLSPWLHFGQISAQAVALDAAESGAPEADREAFIEELVVRRELSDNFCYYNDHYDAFDGFADWAKKTLNEHRKDKREHLYDEDALEAADTHDPLWNAAQRQMVTTGKMHGYLRMYWAKKILEWTESPEEALRIGIALNDRYSLDGRDPNGYVGVAWSVGGVHDRAWSERDVFGKIRYMSYDGCRRKFDVDAFVEKHGGPDRDS